MYNLIIDQGNSNYKVALVSNETIESEVLITQEEIHTFFDLLIRKKKVYSYFNIASLERDFFFIPTKIDSVIYSSVSQRDLLLLEFLHRKLPSQKIVELDNLLITETINSFGIDSKYDFGQLGVDRFAALVAAKTIFGNRDVFIIDIGTAITYDLLIGGENFIGGNISPGFQARGSSLYEKTTRLPLVENVYKVDSVNLLGLNTIEAIEKGIFFGLQAEIKSYIKEIKIKYPQINILFTGGMAKHFIDKDISQQMYVPDLLILGLREILSKLI